MQRQRRERPNCFVAFRITDASITAGIVALQQRIAHAFPAVASCLVDPQTLHVTLCMLLLRDDNDVKQAAEILTHAGAVLAPQCFASSAPALAIGGWSFFAKKNVLYSPMHIESDDGTRFVRFVKQLLALCDGAGLTPGPDNRLFTPHVTLWKAWASRASIQRANAALQQANSDCKRVQDAMHAFLQAQQPACDVFGSERFVSIELLSLKERASDGYYRAFAQAPIGVSADPDALPLATTASEEDTAL